MSDAGEKSGLISTKKLAGSVANYIWESPCLKQLVYNPFIVSTIILLIIWLIDFVYGKRFEDGGATMTIQHLLTIYIAIAGGVVMNNMLIKHRYRLDKVTGGRRQEESSEEGDSGIPDDPSQYISEYA